MSSPTPTPATIFPAPSAASSAPEERLRYLPAPAREAFRRFHASGDPAALDEVIFAVMADHLPRASSEPLAALPGSTRLVEDLGFDSLAITEAVFALEDLFEIGISNQEIVLVRTLDDLRGFVRGKLAARTVR